MKYSKKAFDLTEQELIRRKNASEAENQRRIAEISVLAPEIGMLQRSLSNTGLELMNLVVSGRDDIAQVVEKVKEKNLRTQAAIGDLLQAVKGDRDYLTVVYSCANCNDTGFSNGVRCDCMKRLLKKYTVEEINKNCHIKTNNFSDFRLDYYDNSPINGISPREKMSSAYNYCLKYAENFPSENRSLLFVGRTGLGKTFLSSCIAKTVINKGFDVVFGSTIDFIRAVENEHFGRAEGDTMQTLIDCDLLIMDDLGSEFKTSFTESALYAIINGRLNLDKPTITSTNLSYKELGEMYNERIVSRITCSFDPIQFLGKDIRHLKRQMGY